MLGLHSGKYTGMIGLQFQPEGAPMEDFYRLSQTQLAVFNRPYNRYFLKEHNLAHRLGIIAGQRGVGKTTAMIQRLLNVAGQDPFPLFPVP